ncbi:hypothetical protein LCGC14_0382660 [marine sediment metagenome]|uniref:HTH cro/C1-type domain-containing protein n=1 Tax=marine sediment metagenome TaxID=412755 RepID=A0A0F9TK54_9ZZZZ
MKSISQRLCEVRDQEFGGSEKKMWKAWDVNPSTLNRWLNGERVPDATSYDLLARKLGISIEEVHAACQIERDLVARL